LIEGEREKEVVVVERRNEEGEEGEEEEEEGEGLEDEEV